MTYQELITDMLEAVRVGRIALDDDIQMANELDGRKIKALRWVQESYQTLLEVEIEEQN